MGQQTQVASELFGGAVPDPAIAPPIIIATVVIGRNEGARLMAALSSVARAGRQLVYVDSRSTDDSVAIAAATGVICVQLEEDVALTAARARNEGLRTLLSMADPPTAVFFMDGDCVASQRFVDAAVEVLEQEPDVVAVCGWRAERDPQRNRFHRVCDVEWHQGEVGDVDAFGGDVVIRTSAIEAVNGYDASLIAGEDPELAARLRDRGGKIRRVDVESTLHDIAMATSRQWWRRAERSGYAYAAAERCTRALTTPIFGRERGRIIRWGLVAPLVAVVLTPWTRVPLAALAARALMSGTRAARSVDPSRGAGDRLAWGVSCAISPYPNAIGLLRYEIARALRRRPELIEYK